MILTLRSGAERPSGAPRRTHWQVAGLTVALGLSLLPAVATRAQDAATTTTVANRTNARFQVPMAVDWKYTSTYFPNNPSAPIIAGNMGYFSAGNRLYAVELQTGSLKWRYPSDGNLPAYVQTTPAFADGTLYVGTGDGLYAISAEDGKLKYPAFKVKTGVVTSPAIVGDGVYFGDAGGRLYALNTKTGEPLGGAWRTSVDAGGDISGDIAVGVNTLYYLTSNQALHAIDTAGGTSRWVQRIDGEVRGVTPVPSGENLYLASGSLIYNFRPTSGSLRWTLPRRLPNAATCPVGVDSDGDLFVVTADRYIYALNSLNKPIWKFAPRLDFDVSAQPIVVGDLLILGTNGGGVYAFDRTSGMLKWNYAIKPSAQDPNYLPPFTKVAARPVAAGDALYVLTDDGTLTSFRHDATDNQAPAVTNLDPAAGEYLNARPPFTISAKVADDGSGLNTSTISLKLDDTPIARRPEGDQFVDKPGYTYNADTGVLEYLIVENESGKTNALADGHHTVTVSAKDWMGNTATKTWIFTVDDTLPKRAKRTNGQPGLPGGRGGGGGFGGFGGGAGGGGGGGKG